MTSTSTSTSSMFDDDVTITLQLLCGSDLQLSLPRGCSRQRASELIARALGGGSGDLVLVDTGSGERVLLPSGLPSSGSPSSSSAAPPPEAPAKGEEPLFRDGAVFLALPAPKPPPERVRRRKIAGEETNNNNNGGGGRENGNDFEEEDEDDLFRYRPPSNKLARLLAEQIRARKLLPDPLLAVLLRVPRKVWLFLVLWPLGAKLASRYSLGPIFILLSILAAVVFNLGERKPGEASAYSVFNEGFRSLLGEFRAEAIDEGLRRGGQF